MAFTEDSCSRRGSQPYSLNLPMPGFSCYVKSLSGKFANRLFYRTIFTLNVMALVVNCCIITTINFKCIFV